jgi:hypothetical protein
MIFMLGQVFVHSLVGNIAFKKDDVSWVTQLTTDRIDIFSKVCVRVHSLWARRQFQQFNISASDPAG